MTLKMRVGLLGVLLVGAAAYAIAEDLTVATTYPSPRGVYKQLRVGSGTFAAPTAPLHVVKPDDDGEFALRVDDQDNDTTPFVITQVGRVGIGTAAPEISLHVVGLGILDEGPPGGPSGASLLLRSTAAGGHSFSFISGPSGLCPAGKFCVSDTPVLAAPLLTINPLTAAPDQGNVGIGTSAPAARLHVNGGGVLIEDVANPAFVSLKSTAAGAHQWSVVSSTSVGACPNPGFLCLYDGTVGLPRLTINPVGRVGIGIGTSNPGSGLSVGANVAVGGAYALLAAPANSLIVEGNVGIGTSAPGAKLDVVGEVHLSGTLFVGSDTTIQGHLQTNGSVGVNGNVDVNGSVDVTGTVHAASDARLKTNIAPLTGALDKLDQLHGISFDWNARHQPKEPVPTRQIGLIAQDVEAVYPELVASFGPEGYKGVDYMRLTSVLVEAIKELKRHDEEALKELKQSNDDLRRRIDALERRLDREATRPGSSSP